MGDNFHVKGLRFNVVLRGSHLRGVSLCYQYFNELARLRGDTWLNKVLYCKGNLLEKGRFPAKISSFY